MINAYRPEVAKRLEEISSIEMQKRLRVQSHLCVVAMCDKMQMTTMHVNAPALCALRCHSLSINSRV